MTRSACARAEAAATAIRSSAPIEAVASDVRQGYVSVEAAAKFYAVIIDPETFIVDMAATERLRRARRNEQGKAGSGMVAS